MIFGLKYGCVVSSLAATICCYTSFNASSTEAAAGLVTAVSVPEDASLGSVVETGAVGVVREAAETSQGKRGARTHTLP